MSTTRRAFLAAAAGLGASALTAPWPARGARPAAAGAADVPWFGISLAQWSLHRSLQAGDLDVLDVPAVAAERFGVAAVEYVNTFFRDRAGDFAWLGELRRRADEAGVASLLIMVDGEGHLADPDEARRRAAVESHFRWIAAAGFLGCHAVRVNASGSGSAEAQRDRAADSLVRLARLGEDYDVDVLVENHGGLSSDGGWLASVMRAADHPRVGTLPDFGNFHLGEGRFYDRYRGVAELMPFAKAVSAKSHDFDERGEETATDYRRMLTIVRDAGYRGWIGIEYEGSRLDEDEGILATKALLERLRAELSP